MIAWPKLRYHPEQSQLWREKNRLVTVCAGRGSGKTELARRRVVRFLAVKKQWPDPIYFYALPTYPQARRVAWGAIKKLVPSHWIDHVSETAMSISTIFGSTLYVVGMDKPQRIEGNQWDGGVIDESSDQKPGVFSRSILPALAHKDAWCWRIGVPKRYGVGAREFKNAFDDNRSASYHWTSESILTTEQIVYAKENTSDIDYREQYLASWESVSGVIFYSYDDVLNVQDVTYRPDMPLCVSCDFNVNPMCWVVAHRYPNELEVIDELFVRNTNTPEMMKLIERKYGDHKAGFEFYGDATGRARKTSATMSDYLIIKNSRLQPKIFFKNSNPPLQDRFASCNALFRNTIGDRRCKIHPRCKRLRDDLMSRSYKEGSNEPNDGFDDGHMSDALGYLIWYRYPMRTVLNYKPKVSVHQYA